MERLGQSCVLQEEEKDRLGAGDGEFPGPGDGLHHDIGLFDARGEELCFCAGDERFDYCCWQVSGLVIAAAAVSRGGLTDSCSSGHGRCQFAGRYHRASEPHRGL